MGKKKKKTIYKQPYKNMAARRTVLVIGLIVSIISLLLVAFGAMLFFIPSMNFFSASPLPVFMIIFGIGAGLAFVGLVFAVAGANTGKPLARISFALALIAFFVGMGFFIAGLLFHTILPVPAMERLWPKS